MEYSLFKKLILFIIAFYFVCGLATEILPTGQEKSAVPFYSWFLFQWVPNKMRVYGIRIYENGGKKVSAPVLFQDGDGVVSDPKSPLARFQTTFLAQAISKKDEAEVQRIASRFEAAFLLKNAVYEVGLISYNPIERVKSGKYDFSPLRKFSYGN